MTVSILSDMVALFFSFSFLLFVVEDDEDARIVEPEMDSVWLRMLWPERRQVGIPDAARLSRAREKAEDVVRRKDIAVEPIISYRGNRRLMRGCSGGARGRIWKSKAPRRIVLVYWLTKKKKDFYCSS